MVEQLATCLIDQSCVWLENGQQPTVILYSDYCALPLTLHFEPKQTISYIWQKYAAPQLLCVEFYLANCNFGKFSVLLLYYN